MVEGPKVLLRSQKLQFLVGQTFTAVLNLPIEQFQNAINEKVTHLFSVGKELIITLETICVRLHFGMSGWEMIKKTTDDFTFTSNKSYIKLSGVLVFDKTSVAFFETAISRKPVSYANVVQEKSCKDVLLPNFSYDAVLGWLYNRDSRVIMDSIMDQNILPGVGNVIKCEGLFRAGINPYEITKTIDQRLLHTLIRHIQEFSFEWFNATKYRNRILRKCVYGLSNCLVCNSIISLVRDGNIQRITYFCPRCQQMRQNDICRESPFSTAPTYISQTCDFIGHRLSLSMPSSSSESLQQIHNISKENVGPNIPSATSCILNDILKEIITVDDSSDSSFMPVRDINSSQTHRRTLLINNDQQPDYGSQINSSSNYELTSALDSRPPNYVIHDLSQRQVHVPIHESHVESIENFSFFHQPVCACKVPAGLQRVRKEGPTMGRLYWACTWSTRACSDVGARGKKCDFFHWADTLFPRCKCAPVGLDTIAAVNTQTQVPASSPKIALQVAHSTPELGCAPSSLEQHSRRSRAGPPIANGPLCSLRRVLKPGPTNGRFFFSCLSQSRNKQCGHFLWASAWNEELSRRRMALNNSNSLNNSIPSPSHSGLNSAIGKRTLEGQTTNNGKLMRTATFSIPL